MNIFKYSVKFVFITFCIFNIFGCAMGSSINAMRNDDSETFFPNINQLTYPESYLSREKLDGIQNFFNDSNLQFEIKKCLSFAESQEKLLSYFMVFQDGWIYESKLSKNIFELDIDLQENMVEQSRERYGKFYHIENESVRQALVNIVQNFKKKQFAEFLESNESSVARSDLFKVDENESKFFSIFTVAYLYKRGLIRSKNLDGKCCTEYYNTKIERGQELLEFLVKSRMCEFHSFKKLCEVYEDEIDKVEINYLQLYKIFSEFRQTDLGIENYKNLFLSLYHPEESEVVIELNKEIYIFFVKKYVQDYLFDKLNNRDIFEGDVMEFDFYLDMEKRFKKGRDLTKVLPCPLDFSSSLSFVNHSLLDGKLLKLGLKYSIREFAEIFEYNKWNSKKCYNLANWRLGNHSECCDSCNKREAKINRSDIKRVLQEENALCSLNKNSKCFLKLGATFDQDSYDIISILMDSEICLYHKYKELEMYNLKYRIDWELIDKVYFFQIVNGLMLAANSDLAELMIVIYSKGEEAWVQNLCTLMFRYIISKIVPNIYSIDFIDKKSEEIVKNKYSIDHVYALCDNLFETLKYSKTLPLEKGKDEECKVGEKINNLNMRCSTKYLVENLKSLRFLNNYGRREQNMFHENTFYEVIKFHLDRVEATKEDRDLIFSEIKVGIRSCIEFICGYELGINHEVRKHLSILDLLLDFFVKGHILFSDGILYSFNKDQVEKLVHKQYHKNIKFFKKNTELEYYCMWYESNRWVASQIKFRLNKETIETSNLKYLEIRSFRRPNNDVGVMVINVPNRYHGYDYIIWEQFFIDEKFCKVLLINNFLANGYYYIGEFKNYLKKHSRSAYFIYGKMHGYGNLVENFLVSDKKVVRKFKGKLINGQMCNGTIQYYTESKLYNKKKLVDTYPGDCIGSSELVISKFSGNMIDDKLNDEGVGPHINVGRFEGSFKDNEVNGVGVYIWSDGAKFEGVFQFGKKVTGKMVCANGDVFEGGWLDEKPYNGIIRRALKNGLIYTSYVKNGVRIFDGENNFYWNNDGIYVGGLMNDQRHGKGKCRFINGDIYEGEWRNGNLYYGKVIFYNVYSMKESDMSFYEEYFITNMLTSEFLSDIEPYDFIPFSVNIEDIEGCKKDVTLSTEYDNLWEDFDISTAYCLGVSDDLSFLELFSESCD